MKKKSTILVTVILILVYTTNLYSQEDKPYLYKFNRIDYYAPGSQYLPSTKKTLKNNSYITIDFNLQKITIISYFSNEPTESIYKIEKVSKLQNNEYYRITCLASNYAEVIIDLNTKGRWIKRKISHNGIYHKYYNYAVN